ncbi:MAG TPA: M56 family metallopeptidase, partial [Gemmatimonadaceae bacterium]|nr:M56 family metallopeptidase [Gemmatimonadaceae bacterium]
VHLARSATPAAGALTLFDRDWWARTQEYDPIINRIWWTVSLILLVWGIANAVRVAVLIAMSRRQSASRAPSVVDGIPIVVTDELGPATVGLVRSRVLVPRWVLTLPGVQRRYVLRHEEEHRRSHDAHLLLFASLLVLPMPWNLAMWWMLKRLALAVELDCDNRVVAALGDRPAYGELLLTVAEAASRGPRLQPAFLGGAGSLEQRLRALISPAPLRRAQKFALPMLTLALLLIVVWMPHPILGPNCSSAHTLASITANK